MKNSEGDSRLVGDGEREEECTSRAEHILG